MAEAYAVPLFAEQIWRISFIAHHPPSPIEALVDFFAAISRNNKLYFNFVSPLCLRYSLLFTTVTAPMENLELFDELFEVARQASATVGAERRQYDDRVAELSCQIGPLSVEGVQPGIGFFRETGRQVVKAVEYGFGINQHPEATFDFVGIERRPAKRDGREFVVLRRNSPHSTEKDSPGTVWLVDLQNITTDKTKLHPAQAVSDGNT